MTDRLVAGLRCREVEDLAPAFVLGALEPSEMETVRNHLAACPEAHPEMAELGSAAASMLLAVPQVEPPAALGSRILEAARRDTVRIDGSNCREIIDNMVDMAHFYYIHFAFPTFFKNVFEGHIATQYLRSKARPDKNVGSSYSIDGMTLSSRPCSRKTGTDGFGDRDSDSAGSAPYAPMYGRSRAPRCTTSRSVTYRSSVADGSCIVFATPAIDGDSCVQNPASVVCAAAGRLTSANRNTPAITRFIDRLHGPPEGGHY